MHGRLKVRSTAEQEETKRKERENKLLLYKKAVTVAFEKRSNGIFDDEALNVTSLILEKNPDFYTMWNFRREIFLDWNVKKNADQMQQLFEAELHFLEQCLRINPKSYNAWHHRGWVLQTMPRPDWKRELRLCSDSLEQDERNFHCWDYRRFVAKSSSVHPEKEFEFSTLKICANFSNFSSWHYRSKLLPVIYPDPTQPSRVREDILLNEYELVQNAFFTDPNDQSAWFYHRWLLGRDKRPLIIKCVHVARHSSQVAVLISHPAKYGKEFVLDTFLNGSKITEKLQWIPLSNCSNTQYSNIWEASIDESFQENEDREYHLSVTLVIYDECQEKGSGDDGGQEKSVDVTFPAKSNDAFWRLSSEGLRYRCEHSAATLITLRKELEACQALHELEPDNKWTMLTIVSLMRALDNVEDMSSTLEYLEKLIVVDPMRINYYQQLKSKFLIENAIESLADDERLVDFGDLGLVALYHVDDLLTFQEVELSRNALHSVQGLHQLRCVKILRLDGNKLTTLDGINDLENLEELSVKNNDIKEVRAFESLSSCSSLHTLHIKGNPVSTRENLPGLQALLPGINILLPE